jgi:hypothetical protein
MQTAHMAFLGSDNLERQASSRTNVYEVLARVQSTTSYYISKVVSVDSTYEESHSAGTDYVLRCISTARSYEDLGVSEHLPNSGHLRKVALIGTSAV